MLDVRHLPSFGFGHRSLMWWGTMGLMLIRRHGVRHRGNDVLSICAASPLTGRSPRRRPTLLWGSAEHRRYCSRVLWPNQLAKRAADREQRGRARLWLVGVSGCSPSCFW